MGGRDRGLKRQGAEGSEEETEERKEGSFSSD